MQSKMLYILAIIYILSMAGLAGYCFYLGFIKTGVFIVILLALGVTINKE